MGRFADESVTEFRHWRASVTGAVTSAPCRISCNQVEGVRLIFSFFIR